MEYRFGSVPLAVTATAKDQGALVCSYEGTVIVRRIDPKYHFE